MAMSYKIVWKRRARRQLDNIQTQDATRILKKVRGLADREAWKNVKALKNHAYQYRLRVGNYRVLFDIRDGVEILDVEEVCRRNEQTY